MDASSNAFDIFITLIKWVSLFGIVYILRQPLKDLLNRLIEVSLGHASAKFHPVGEIVAPSVTGPPVPLPDQPIKLLPEAKKILGTLWFHQKKHFGNDRSKIWTFEVLPNAINYPIYLEGLSQLVQHGFALIVSETHHCALTQRGYDYCQEHQDEFPKDDKIYKWD